MANPKTGKSLSPGPRSPVDSIEDYLGVFGTRNSILNITDGEVS